MELRPQLQLQTVIKAMNDVILPALDPGNSLAQEQAHLAVGMLTLLMQRLPLAYRYERDELTRFLALAETLARDAAGLPDGKAALQALAEARRTGADVLARAGAEPRELESANFRLREDIGAVISAVYAETNTADLKQLSTAVLAHAQQQALRERSWLITQGWETNPESIPPIESLIGEK